MDFVKMADDFVRDMILRYKLDEFLNPGTINMIRPMGAEAWLAGYNAALDKVKTDLFSSAKNSA